MAAMRAIETIWNGYRFRSRLEARWAVFFDSLDFAFQYEPEGFDLDGLAYLPDFWVPEWEAYVEIKGPSPADMEVEKARRLADASDKVVLLISGPPWLGEYKIREFPDWNWAEAGYPGIPAEARIWDGLCVCRRCDGFCLGALDGSWHDIGLHSCGDHMKRPIAETERLRTAYTRARQARFEHGERP